MKTFQWKSEKNNKEVKQKKVKGSNSKAVTDNFTQLRITPTKIKKKPKNLFANIFLLRAKVKQSDIIIFCRQFSTMIDAGVPIIQCLEILYSQQKNKEFKNILRSIKESIECGETLAETFKKYPKQFDNLFINMIAAGEKGGILDTILRRLSLYMEKAAKIKSQLKGAMIYPIITIIIAIVVIAVIMVFVIPVFKAMFEGMGGSLPLSTQLVVHMSDFIKNHILYIIGCSIITIYAVKKYYNTEKGRILLDSLLLKLPVLGMLINKIAIAKFTRAMSTMLASGVAILDALDIVAKTTGNKIIEKALYDVSSGIEEGYTMATQLSASKVFPSMVCQMIAVGENTGTLDQMLSKIADFYDEEVDQAVENMTVMIEPLMMVFLGIAIGGLVVAMYLPIFKIASAISG